MAHFIKGNRVFLREVRLTDVNEKYYNWLADKEINQFLETRYMPRSIDNIKAFVKEMDGNSNELFFAICTLEDDCHIGNIKLGPIDWVHKFGEVGLLIGDKDYWGKGYAKEVIELLSAFAFDVLNLNKLNAGVLAKNIASQKAFKNAGFTEEGRLKDQWIIHNQPQDQVQMGFRRVDFYAEK